MDRLVSGFIRGFCFYKVLMPNKFFLHEKNIEDILERDMFYIQKDMDIVDQREKE